MQLLFLQYILFVLLGHAMGFRDISPVGPRMCASLCRSTYGCSVYVFSPSHLTCHLVNEQYTWEGPAVKMDNTQFQDEASAHADPPCHMFSLIFHDRGGKICCAKLTDDVYGPSNRTLRSRLLVTDYKSSRSKPVYQIFTEDFSSKIYPDLSLKAVQAMIYFPSSRALVVSRPSLSSLSAISVDTNIRKTIKKHVICNSMAIDNQRNLLLLAVVHSEPAIYTMTSEGHNYSLLFRFNMIQKKKLMFPSAIFKDPKQDLVYICLCKKIISVDFNGKATVIKRGGGLFGMTFNPQESVLYYSDNTKLMKLSLLDKHESQIKDFQGWVTQIVFYEGYVHVSVFGNIRSASTKNTTILNIPLKKMKRSILCALP